MKPEDISDYLRLRKSIENPWALVRLRKRRQPREHGELFEVRFRDGRVFCLRPGTRDAHIFNRLFVRDEYQIGKKDRTGFECAIDVGGHIGTFSFMVAPRSRRVLVFEPISEHFGLLKRNMSQFPHVQCVNAAVTDTKKELKIYKPWPGGKSRSGAQTRPAEDNFETASGISLKDIFVEYDVERCDLLKLDCEGAEYEILFTLPDYVLSRISRIVMEYHDDSPKPKSEWTVESLRKYLKEKGFSVFARARKRNRLVGIMDCTR
ncbi:FkbM family methyltransferase [Candidatus Poribacteria bacterium]|nr:FkbM family methyltransferase [Candidatus Poribacteria bacterium]